MNFSPASVFFFHFFFFFCFLFFFTLVYIGTYTYYARKTGIKYGIDKAFLHCTAYTRIHQNYKITYFSTYVRRFFSPSLCSWSISMLRLRIWERTHHTEVLVYVSSPYKKRRTWDFYLNENILYGGIFPYIFLLGVHWKLFVYMHNRMCVCRCCLSKP